MLVLGPPARFKLGPGGGIGELRISGCRVVKEYLAQLKQVPQALDQLAGRTLKGADKLFEIPEFELKAPEPVKLPVKIDLLADTKVDDGEYKLPDYGAIFSNAAKGIASGGGELRTQFDTFRQGLLDFNTGSEEALNQLREGLINGLSGIGEAIGSSLFDGSSIGSNLAAGLAPIIDALAEFAAKKGKLYIAMGIADLAIPGLQAQGLAEIAGGTALLIAAGVARAGAGALAASARPSVGGGGGGGGGFSTTPASRTSNFSPTVAPNATAAAPVTYTHYVEITASGRNLKGALALETDRLGRVVGVH